MKKDSNLFYFSNYNKDHPLCDSINKNVIAKFKNECPQEAITEFTGLKSKMYSIQTETKTKKTVKGVKKSVINQEITHEDYQKTILNNTSMRHSRRAIRSQLHNIYYYELSKRSLSCFDDKRWIYEDGIYSWAYSHCQIAKNIKFGQQETIIIRKL